MFATLLLVRLIRKSRQAEEAFRFYSSFKATQCFKNLLCLIEIKEVFCKKFNEDNSKAAVWFKCDQHASMLISLILRLSSSIRIGLWLLRAGKRKALGSAHPRNRNETRSSL